MNREEIEALRTEMNHIREALGIAAGWARNKVGCDNARTKIKRGLDAQRAVKAALSSVPLLEGWRLVPVELDLAPDMRGAGELAFLKSRAMASHLAVPKIWTAMLSSAPSLQGGGDLGSVGSRAEARTPSPSLANEPANRQTEDAQTYKDALHDLVMLKAQDDIGCVPAPTKEQWAKAWAEAEDLVRVEP